MRFVSTAFIASICLASQVSAAPPRSALDNPAYSDPARKWTSIDDATGAPVISEETRELLEKLRNQRKCSDTISKARAEAGLPMTQREPASPDKPYLVYAVDRREDGCSVMVMKGDTDDIRQLPKPIDGPAGIIPAESER